MSPTTKTATATATATASTTLPPRLSASVVLLRRTRRPVAHAPAAKTTTATATPYEVLMVKRASQLKSFANLYVFPGGVTEPTDGPSHERETAKRCALRELFEETGILLTSASSTTAKVVRLPHDEAKAAQTRVNKEPTYFDALMRDHHVTPPTASMAFWVTFITPVIEPRRFRTEFFVALLDDSESTDGMAVHLDSNESVEFKWVTPHEAIAFNRAGNMRFLPPQFFVLSNIAAFADPAELMQRTLARDEADEPVEILPHAVSMDDKELVLAYPGDEAHPVFPGERAQRHRMHVAVPMGNGFSLETTWNKPAITKRDWAALSTKRAKEVKAGGAAL